MEELHILLIPNKEHNKVFPNVPVIGFRNCKSPKYYFVGVTLPILNETGRCEPCGNKICLVWDAVITATTFTTEAFQGTFKIQCGPLNCYPEKVLYLKANFVIGLIVINLNIECLERVIEKFRNYFVNQKLFHTHYRNFILTITIETYAQLKERETFWQHGLRTFYPIGLYEKEEYLC